MKKVLRSSLAIIMAVVMCLSLLPATALALSYENQIRGSIIWSFDDETGILRVDGTGEIAKSTFTTYAGGMNIKTVILGDGITGIGDNTFLGADELSSIDLPNNVTSIGANAFLGAAFTSVTVYSHINYAGGTYQANRNLTNVTIESGVTIIRGHMFQSCKSLKSITIPDSVTEIGEQAFFEAGLTSVTIPDSVTEIGNQAFSKSVTIFGSSGSVAETYANYNGNTFVSTGGATTPTDPQNTTEPQDPQNSTRPTGDAPNLDSATGWAHEQINEAYKIGLIPTALQGRYTQATTRAEFCALATALYETVTGTTITERKTFDDTTDINVEKMAALGVVNGVGNNRFDPNAGLTREQAATMLSRLAKAVGKPLTQQAATFSDNGKIASWAIEAVGQMQAAGVMGGTSTTTPTFDPQGAYTREQSIVTMLRLYNIVK